VRVRTLLGLAPRPASDLMATDCGLFGGLVLYLRRFVGYSARHSKQFRRGRACASYGSAVGPPSIIICRLSDPVRRSDEDAAMSQGTVTWSPWEGFLLCCISRRNTAHVMHDLIAV